MEHCEGGDLRHAISQRAATGEYFSEEQVLTWISQVTLALQFIHQHQVLHRDLKCSNIFLDGSRGRSTVKLGDFGICRVLEGSTDIANTLVGTPYYMSPEVCSNTPYSYKSDIWSLGCVLYELCVLKHAFEHATLQGLVSRIKSGVYEPIPACYSEGLNELVASLITLSTEQRPSIDEVCASPLLMPWLERQHKELPELAVLDPEARERSKQHRRSISPKADWMERRFSGHVPGGRVPHAAPHGRVRADSRVGPAPARERAHDDEGDLEGSAAEVLPGPESGRGEHIRVRAAAVGRQRHRPLRCGGEAG
ncbi:unnamed protein product [Prorocentrum cordatum]|uniref:non-specific serine/threonine protein kinase n=1 Tax=Prorocentrum cordatum TaxID=2364126 RepID=A0ABN9SUB9_9DINO|nr:unnamed protein product [Polarella glacialis]